MKILAGSLLFKLTHCKSIFRVCVTQVEGTSLEAIPGVSLQRETSHFNYRQIQPHLFTLLSIYNPFFAKWMRIHIQK